MRRWHHLLCLTLIGLATSAAAQTATPPAGRNEDAVPAVMQRAGDEVIRPGYRNMQQSAALLTTAMKDLCADGTQQT
ncbi:hypothetical protein AB9F35_34885, partial [Rhizobium leguminosarum]